MRSPHRFVITALVVCHLFPGTPLVTSQARPETAPGTAPEQNGRCHLSLTAPLAITPPRPAAAERKESKAAAEPKSKLTLPIQETEPVNITADQCEKAGEKYTLRGNVEIDFRSYRVQGDTISYDSSSGTLEAKGHLSFDGGPHDMHLTASHGAYDTRSQTGQFYDVSGTTGARFRGKNVTLTSSNPIAFTGREVEKTGPELYVIHHGSVTSCELPHPKWTFNAGKIELDVGTSAKIYNTTFRVKKIPVLYLPFAEPPVERLGRQSGFLIPSIGTSSTKGTVLGDSFYWAISRSMDATLGGEYLSKRGWALHETYRAVPSHKSYLNLDYFGVLDRGIGSSASKNDQGGEDVKLNGEGEFPKGFRGVASVEYLSSFLFRQAFTENFSQAVNSEVTSSAFLSKSTHGFSFNAFASRYQNFQSITAGDAITILHTPGVELSGVEKRLPKTPFYWSYDAAAEGLRRSEPGFVTPNLVGRFDIEPTLSLPIFRHGWTIRAQASVRDTYYTVSQQPITSGLAAIEEPINRGAVETEIEVRPPTLEKVFNHGFAGRTIKHTLEPRLVYRYINGADNLLSVVRFDFRDIFSDSNEAEFGLTQRIYAKRNHEACSPLSASGPPAAKDGPGKSEESQADACLPSGADEFITWEVKAKYFFDPNFGGVITNGRRNVLDSTVGFTGIAFLTDPRRFSPIVSRLRVRTSGNSDLQWQLDYDSKKGRINDSTFITTFHFGNFFIGASHAYLQVPGEIVISPVPDSGGQFLPLPSCVPGTLNQPTCVPSRFNQLRALLGFGSPTKRGVSAAANVGFDAFFHFLQYSAAQASYNWDCCGVSLAYRRFALGSVRNENQFRFAFTLANIETFGNLKRELRLF